MTQNDLEKKKLIQLKNPIFMYLKPFIWIVVFCVWVRALEAQTYSDLEALDETDLVAMPSDSPMFRYALSQVILRHPEGERPKWFLGAFSELKRRGNRLTPLLLELFQENPEKEFRADLLTKLDFVPTIDKQPFLNAARKLWATEGPKLEPRTCYSIAWMLSRNGTEQDRQILRQMMNHPVAEVAFVIKPDLEHLDQRLKSKNAASESVKSMPSMLRPPLGLDR